MEERYSSFTLLLLGKGEGKGKERKEGEERRNVTSPAGEMRPLPGSLYRGNLSIYGD